MSWHARAAWPYRRDLELRDLERERERPSCSCASLIAACVARSSVSTCVSRLSASKSFRVANTARSICKFAILSLTMPKPVWYVPPSAPLTALADSWYVDCVRMLERTDGLRPGEGTRCCCRWYCFAGDRAAGRDGDLAVARLNHGCGCDRDDCENDRDGVGRGRSRLTRNAEVAS